MATSKSIPQFPPSLRLGVIGGGVMAGSILFPLFDQGALDPKNVLVAGNTPENLTPWMKRGCSTVSKNNGKVLNEVDVVIWSVKPQVFPRVVEALAEDHLQMCKESVGTTKNPLHISVMGGVTLETFTSRLAGIQNLRTHSNPVPCRTVRTMPNIGHGVGAGCTVFTMGPHAQESDRTYVEALFSPTGICREVPESQVNAFSALTGSGIGWMFPILEALSDGAVKVGLGREISLKMAAQTMKGAAELYLKEGTHPGVLKDRVCSPGGSTIAGIAELERAGLRIGLINAIEATVKRSEELGKLA